MNSRRISIDRKTGMLIAKNLIVMLVLIIVALFSSFSWFVQTTKTSADGIYVASQAPDGLEIAIVAHNDPAPEDKDYVEGTILLSSDNCKFLEDLYFSEITGSGENDKFYKPKLTQANGIAVPDKDADWDKAKANIHYISFDLYMRSKSAKDVFLQESTSVTPISSTLKWDSGDASDAFNPSTAGSFSRDCIVGATRLSILDKKGVSKLLWIPAPNIELSKDAKTISTDLTTGDSFKHFYYAVDGNAKTLTEAKNVTTNDDGDYTLGSKLRIAELNQKDDNDEYFVNYVTCHFWIEGEDQEARLALTGGKFKLNLQLTIN